MIDTRELLDGLRGIEEAAKAAELWSEEIIARVQDMERLVHGFNQRLMRIEQQLNDAP